jgi:UDP-N-acetylglucosamine--N-acetylmuramyl-(pentapeptide) pyrophosphoryl-undecaprenol N-acetylglucosamine transferase
MRVMIAGGGTGGHIYPGIAMYRALQRLDRSVEVLFVGAKSGVEGPIFRELGLPHILLSGRGVRGTSVGAKLTSPLVFLSSIVRGIREILVFKPDVVVGTGGFASVAVVVASIVCRRKRVLQEQNSVPGMANRALSRFAHLVLLSYRESRAFFGSGVACAVVGNPLRVKPGGDRRAAFGFFGLSESLPTVLVVGGSRGAHSVNELSRAAAEAILAKRKIQFVFLTGEKDFADVKARLEPYGAYVRVLPFLHEIQHAYAVADLAVSRAGASAVFELAAFAVPSIFIPYPHAADDHQKKNVAELAGLGAAVVLDDRSTDARTLETVILTLLDRPVEREEMARKLRKWSPVDADAEAARQVAEIVRTGEARLSEARLNPRRRFEILGVAPETRIRPE